VGKVVRRRPCEADRRRSRDDDPNLVAVGCFVDDHSDAGAFDRSRAIDDALTFATDPTDDHPSDLATDPTDDHPSDLAAGHDDHVPADNDHEWRRGLLRSRSSAA
jgi:hypothetical protein